MARRRAARLPLLALLAAALAGRAACYEFNMVFQTKCVMEEVEAEEQKIIGSYAAFTTDDAQTPVVVDARVGGTAGRFAGNNMCCCIELLGSGLVACSGRWVGGQWMVGCWAGLVACSAEAGWGGSKAATPSLPCHAHAPPACPARPALAPLPPAV